MIKFEIMNITELKLLCKKKSISQSGNKQVLINKLKNINIFKKENKIIKRMGDLCDSGRGGIRPRLCFDKIKKQLGNDFIKIIWSGNIKTL